MINKHLTSPQFVAEQFRSHFPALKGETIYLDSASTALKPQVMIDAVQNYYAQHTATVARSLHKEALQTTTNIDKARLLVANFINASTSCEIIWTRGATESINLVAQSYARNILQPKDEIIVSDIEHHSNLLPWLIVAEQTGAKVVKWSVDTVDLSSIITPQTKIVAVTQMSNVTGYCTDIAKISRVTHQHNAILVVDGAQGIVHHPIDVQENDIDFYAFSAHKLYGPTGLGVLYGKQSLLESMPVWQGGGKMLKSASFSGFTAAELPYKFEAGTPHIAGILGFYATLNWLQSYQNWDVIHHYIEELANYAKSQLAKLGDITFYSVDNSPIISFNIADIHHNDIAILLSEQNIAVRTGELCAQPLMSKLGCSGVIRISLMPYNNRQDIDHFIQAMQQAILLLK